MTTTSDRSTRYSTPERSGLVGWLADAAGARAATIVAANELAGGAVQQHWALEILFDDGPLAGRQALVLRANFQTPLPASRSKAEEFSMLRRVYGAGIAAPEPLFLCTDKNVIGAPFLIMRRLPGKAERAPLLAAAERDGFGDALGGELARQLAGLHALPPESADEGPAAAPLLDAYCRWLTDLDGDDAAPRRALDWLAACMPDRPATSLVHRDFRTGNFLVEDGRLAAILDWEFAGPGDPAEDIGWLCARCWRGGVDTLEAGGLTTRATFLAAYEAAGGATPPAEVIAYWEVMAHLRWALIARQQARRAAAGDTPQHELVEAAGRIAGLDADLDAMTG